MKDNQQGAKRGFAGFISGKGFYIVLILCLAIIGVSVWTMINLATPEERIENNTVISGYVPGEVKSSTETEPSVTTPPAEAQEDEAVPPEITETELPAAVVSSTDYEETPVSAQDEEAERVAALEQEIISQARGMFVRPVPGEVIAAYSGDELVYSTTMADWRTHRGVDLYAAVGAGVKAASSGTVSDIRDDALMGTTVVIDHGDGLVSIYSNLEQEPELSVGQEVLVGDVIGVVGSSAIAESSELSHLHFAMQKNGLYVDPGEYIELD